uniref:Uncharacterized protein n=1 Tax=Arundo donax TaxID=35708 RepID=A0A0A9BN16_ARUDO
MFARHCSSLMLAPTTQRCFYVHSWFHLSLLLAICC